MNADELAVIIEKHQKWLAGVIGRQEAKPKAKKGHTMNIKTIIETLENQGFYEVDSLETMGCDDEEIEAARDEVTR